MGEQRKNRQRQNRYNIQGYIKSALTEHPERGLEENQLQLILESVLRMDKYEAFRGMDQNLLENFAIQFRTAQYALQKTLKNYPFTRAV